MNIRTKFVFTSYEFLWLYFFLYVEIKTTWRKIIKWRYTIIVGVSHLLFWLVYFSTYFIVFCYLRTNKLVDVVELSELYNFCSREVIAILLRKKVLKGKSGEHHLLFQVSGVLTFWPSELFSWAKLWSLFWNKSCRAHWVLQYPLVCLFEGSKKQ